MFVWHPNELSEVLTPHVWGASVKQTCVNMERIWWADGEALSVTCLLGSSRMTFHCCGSDSGTPAISQTGSLLYLPVSCLFPAAVSLLSAGETLERPAACNGGPDVWPFPLWGSWSLLDIFFRWWGFLSFALVLLKCLGVSVVVALGSESCFRLEAESFSRYLLIITAENVWLPTFLSCAELSERHAELWCPQLINEMLISVFSPVLIQNKIYLFSRCFLRCFL